MDRITALRVPGRITRQVRTLVQAFGHAALITAVDLVVAGLGLPLSAHIAVGALIFLAIEATLHRQ